MASLKDTVISGSLRVTDTTYTNDLVLGKTYTARHVLAAPTSNGVPSFRALTNADVGLGNVENTKLSTWAGSANLATLKGLSLSGSAAASYVAAFAGTTAASANNAAAVTIAGGLGVAKTAIIGKIKIGTGTSDAQLRTISVVDTNLIFDVPSGKEIIFQQNAENLVRLNGNAFHPETTNTGSLGTSTYRWKGLFLESQAAATSEGIQFYTGTSLDGRVGSNNSTGGIGIYGRTHLWFRPSLSDTTLGFELDNTALYPTTNRKHTLGKSGQAWKNLYSEISHPTLTATGVAAVTSSPYKSARWRLNLGIATPTDGDIVTFTVPVAGTTQGVYLTLNGDSAADSTFKPIAVSGTARLTSHYPVGTTISLVYDADGSVADMYAIGGAASRSTVSGGCWRVLNYYDSGNTNDTSVMYIRVGNAIHKTTAQICRYVMAVVKDQTHIIPINSDRDGTTNNGTLSGHTITTEAFQIFEPFVYNRNNAVYAANASVAAGALWYAYAGIDLRYSFNITTSTFTAHKDVYIKAKLQTATTAKFDTTPVTQTLPTTNDGFIYIKLGRAYNGYCIDLTYDHPIYYHDGTQLQQYVANGIFGTTFDSDGTHTTAVNVNTNMIMTGDTTQSIIRSSLPIKIFPNIASTSAIGNATQGILIGTISSTNGLFPAVDNDSNNNGLSLGMTSKKWKEVVASTFYGDLTGDVTGNVTGNVTGDCSGSSGSCTGNAATAYRINSTVNSNSIGSSWVDARDVALVNADYSDASSSVAYTLERVKFPSYTFGISSERAANVFGIYGWTNARTQNGNDGGFYISGSDMYFRCSTRVYNAVWNDFAEYREGETIEGGRVVYDDGNGKMKITTKRLQSAARIISDTYGIAVGESDTAKTPIGVGGRVLAYTYQNRNNFKVGDAVCAAPNGTIDIMTREEIKEYPDKIIGIVSEIPQYEVWHNTLGDGKNGRAEINVDGRIWIYVR